MLFDESCTITCQFHVHLETTKSHIIEISVFDGVNVYLSAEDSDIHVVSVYVFENAHVVSLETSTFVVDVNHLITGYRLADEHDGVVIVHTSSIFNEFTSNHASHMFHAVSLNNQILMQFVSDVVVHVAVNSVQSLSHEIVFEAMSHEIYVQSDLDLNISILAIHAFFVLQKTENLYVVEDFTGISYLSRLYDVFVDDAFGDVHHLALHDVVVVDILSVDSHVLVTDLSNIHDVHATIDATNHQYFSSSIQYVHVCSIHHVAWSVTCLYHQYEENTGVVVSVLWFIHFEYAVEDVSFSKSRNFTNDVSSSFGSFHVQ